MIKYKSIFLIFLIFLLIFLIIFISINNFNRDNYKTKSRLTKSRLTKSRLTKSLLSNISGIGSNCQDDASNVIIQDINDLKNKGTNIINNNFPSQSSTDLFNKASAVADDVIKRILELPICKSVYGTWKNIDQTITVTINENNSIFISSGSGLKRKSSIGIYNPQDGKICINGTVCDGLIAQVFILDPNNINMAIFNNNGTIINLNRVL